MYERKSRQLQEKIDILEGSVNNSRTEVKVIMAKLRKSVDEVEELENHSDLVPKTSR